MNTETSYSPTVGKLFEALSKAQAKIEIAIKDKENPYFKSMYADLSSIWNVCRVPLSENGLAIVQTIEGTRSESFLVTYLGHSSGEFIKSRLPLMIDKPTPQGMGSAITYARRYALSAIVGVCTDDEDDDGNKAEQSVKEPQKSPYDLEKKKSRDDNFENFAKVYSEENPEIIIEYLNKYAKHYKKNSLIVLAEYADEEKFKKDFMKWKTKEYPSA